MRWAVASAALDGHLELGAHRPPHVAGLVAVLEGLLDGAPAERAEDVVAGDGAGTHGPELVVHEPAEMGQPHGPHDSLGGVDLLLTTTAFDSLGGTVGAVVALLGMIAALVVLLRWWFQNRGR
jgi:hypothetical protein